MSLARLQDIRVMYKRFCGPHLCCFHFLYFYILIFLYFCPLAIKKSENEINENNYTYNGMKKYLKIHLT